MLPTAMNRALKEWAVIVRALQTGQQLVILRKGGISEVGNEFRIEYPEFLFYPTYEHQKADSLIPSAQMALEQTSREAPPTDTVRIAAVARVTASFDILDERQLAPLRPFHVWSDGYVLERLRWRPTKPLAALSLRVYNLPQPVELPFHPSYRGCTSWLTLECELDCSEARPAIEDADYAARVEQLRAALQDVGVLAEQQS